MAHFLEKVMTFLGPRFGWGELEKNSASAPSLLVIAKVHVFRLAGAGFHRLHQKLPGLDRQFKFGVHAGQHLPVLRDIPFRGQIAAGV